MRIVVALALFLAGIAAEAAPCTGFVDVDDSSPFCSSVAWMKNRGITVGCTGTEYCPDVPVTRLQMAAFMSRLGPMTLPPLYDSNGTLVGYYVLAPAHYVSGSLLNTAYPVAQVSIGGFVHHASLRTTEQDGLVKFSASVFEIWYELPNCDDAGKRWVPQGQGTGFGSNPAIFVNLGSAGGQRLAVLGVGAGVPPSPTPQSRRAVDGTCQGWVPPMPWPWSRVLVRLSETPLALPLSLE